MNYWPEAELFRMGMRYDVIIFQKVYWADYARDQDCIKILDVCDPDFLHWNARVVEMIECCHAVAASTSALAQFLSNYSVTPVRVIPDRLDPAAFTGMPKRHEGTGPTRTVAWFGYSHNYPLLDTFLETLVDFKINKLIVISNEEEPYRLAPGIENRLDLLNVAWESATVNEMLVTADVVINPRLCHGRWKYKSNNKSLHAWALGLPVAHSAEELALLLTEDARVRESNRRFAAVFEEHHARKSAEDYIDLINELRSAK